MVEYNKIYNIDCFEGMAQIPDKSIDMILCDLPYGTTNNGWDVRLPFEPLWQSYERVIKDNGCIALFSAQPFTTDLINSNRKIFRYDLIWDKVRTVGFLQAKKRPLRRHESICIFYKSQPVYNPIKEVRGSPRLKGSNAGKVHPKNGRSCYGTYKNVVSYNNEYYPTSILTFSNGDNSKRLHSTQKPVSILAYLIKTYTEPGALILDNCAGSGSTAIAAHQTGRKFICFEKDSEYYKVAKKRIEEEMAQLNIHDVLT